MSNDNFTLDTARDTSTTAFFRTVLTTSMGDKYHGIGSTEKESQVDAVRSYKKYESCRNPALIEKPIAFDFGEAVRKLKAGKKVMRAGWNGKGMFVYYVPAASYPVERNNKATMAGEFADDMVPYREYLALKTAQNDVSTWAPSVSDALAEDWQLA